MPPRTYDSLRAHDLEEDGPSSRALAPLDYHGEDFELSNSVRHTCVHCAGAGVRRPASASGDDIEVLNWRTDDDRFIPSMRRIDRDHSHDAPISSKFPKRKGVQVHYTVEFFTPTEPRQAAPTKKAARKGLWPYRAKY